MSWQSFILFSILLLCSASALDAQQCAITALEARIVRNCNDNGTVPNWDDDYFEAHLTVKFADPPEEGFLLVAGPLLDTIRWPADQLHERDSLVLENVRFKASQKTYKESISLRAWFTAEPGCSKTVNNAGTWVDHNGVKHHNISAPKICSVCVGPPGTTGGKLPECFPPEVPDTSDPCSDVTNYAPDPARPDDTPIQYIKMVLHIFQREHPDSIGRHVVHPQDPGNYTRQHLDLIRSWFTHPDGINGFFQQIPDDPADGSVHIPDARIRFVNQGIEGEDVFFHPDNKAWGMGYSCGGKSTSRYYSQAVGKYLRNPDSTLIGSRYYRALLSDEVKQAMHVFIAGSSWHADDADDAAPDSTDCVYYCTQGYSNSLQACYDPANPPVYVVSGSYYAWLGGQGLFPNCEKDYPGADASLGKHLVGELLHLLAIDHISPFQAHWKHSVGYDGCEDTPLQSSLNRMGCAHQSDSRVLTQCQIGRMHHLLRNLQPGYLRHPQPDGTFSSEKPDDVVEPDIVIGRGEVVRWAAKRELRSNVIVEAGGRLIISCEVGLPANAQLIVHPGGQLLLEGGTIYSY